MTLYDPDRIARYFDDLAGAEWDRFESKPTQAIRLHVHAACLRNHVPPGSRVLEIGAGPGRFTEMLAAMGCHVLVTDISQVQLDLNRARADKEGYASAIEEWQRLDVCDLSALADASFDVVLAFGGPLSYVFDQRDRALQECVRVLKPTGNIVLSVMSFWGTTHMFLKGVMAYSLPNRESVMATGDITPENSPPDSMHYCHMFKSDELREVLERNGLAVDFLSASNALSTNWEAELEEARQDADMWEWLLDLEVTAASQPACWDMGSHLIAVAHPLGAR
jgi:ubiquinone/menaquinone biosynthesis C-methylase UbiE